LQHSQNLHRLQQFKLQPLHRYCGWPQQQMHIVPQQQMPVLYPPVPVNAVDIWQYHYHLQLRLAHEMLWHQEIQRLGQRQVVAATGGSHKYIYPVLPAGFPPHPDSIQAEVFSLQNAHTQEPMQKLQELRRSTLALYPGVVARAPTKYSYARANHPSIPVRFGVSAPHSQSPTGNPEAGIVRAYRVRESWGDTPPPPEEESWKHGQCAESQSLPSVVRDCQRNRLENVVIEIMTIDKSGRPEGMCKNCIRYVFHSLHKQPTWSIYDVARNKLYVT
jgi:hypothetical protein